MTDVMGDVAGDPKRGSVRDGTSAPIEPRTRVPVTKLWTGFVLAWLVVLVAAGALLIQDRAFRARLAVAVVVLTCLRVRYLVATLAEAIGPTDRVSGAPDGRALRRRMALLAAMALLVAALVLLLPGAGMWWLAMHVIVAVGLCLPAIAAGCVIVGVIVVTIGAAWLLSGQLDPLLLILVAFGTAAIAVRQLTIAVAQLRAAREALAHAAVDQERLRFARDLHDLLGHTMSLIILKAELAGRLLPGSPIQAAKEIGDVERSAREALRQARAAAAGYRRPRLGQELQAARELLAAAGVTADIVDPMGPVGSELDGLVAWTIREGVTNVIRHSGARCCGIRLTRMEDGIEVAITDDGRGSATASPNIGHGLAGLAERASALGGAVEAGAASQGGFKLLMRVPVAKEAGT